MKTVEFTLPLFSLAIPFSQVMVVTNNDHVLGHFPGSSVPNYQVPNKADRPNLEEYPVICGGQYLGNYSATGHKQSVPAIVFEDNGPIPIYQSENPRFPKQGPFATYIHIHEAYSDSWRGSAGCPTLAIGGGKFLEHLFDENEEVRIIVPDPFWFVFEGR